MKDHEIRLARLFEDYYGRPADGMIPLAGAGSDRKYYRLHHADSTLIGTFNPDVKENQAFVYFAGHFAKQGLPVPEVLAQNKAGDLYLQTDLGDTSLFNLLQPGAAWSPEAEKLLRMAMRLLARVQIVGGRGLDYAHAYPRQAFDAQSMRWDLNYCHHYFIKLSGVPCDEEEIDRAFADFIEFLTAAPDAFFLYRDFQTRNIMVHLDQPWLIDFQGGRRGALQYDVASILYQSRAGFSDAQRLTLLDTYLEEVQSLLPGFSREQFFAHWHSFVLIRMMQTLGAYGFRGLFERKPLFVHSLEGAVQQLAGFIETAELPHVLKPILGVFERIIASSKFDGFKKSGSAPLKVLIQSFSYQRRGYPSDDSGHGGGFAFDCRFINNPGREEAYKDLTGLDKPVQIFLETQTDMPAYLDHIYGIVEKAIARYLERGFSYLSINFGCTGGQHRSVYAAEKTAAFIRLRFGIEVVVEHLEKEYWPRK